jgi:hypothetical protein
MKLIQYATLIPLINATLIVPKKLCKDCKFFIANEKKCMKFGDLDLVTGEKDFESASFVRAKYDKCGEHAKYFEENNLKFLTVPYYFTLAHWYWYPLIFTYGAWIYATIQTIHK